MVLTFVQCPANWSAIKCYLYDPIKNDLQKKMILLSGPLQVGKTWLAKALMDEFKAPQYLNFDNMADAKIINKQSWPVQNDLLILDEIHNPAVFSAVVATGGCCLGNPKRYDSQLVFDAYFYETLYMIIMNTCLRHTTSLPLIFCVICRYHCWTIAYTVKYRD